MNILIKIFESMAAGLNGHTNGGACRCRLHDDEVCYISRRAVYAGPPANEDVMAVGEAAPYGKGIDALAVKSPDKVTPSSLLTAGRVPLTRDMCEMLMAPEAAMLPVASVDDESEHAIWMLRETAQGEYSLLASLPYGDDVDMNELGLVVMTLPAALVSTLKDNNASLSDFSPELAVTRMGHILALVLVCDASMLMLPLFALAKSKNTIRKITTAEYEVVGTDWNDADLVYNKLVKRGRKKMKGLGSPLKIKAAPAPAPVAPEEEVEEEVACTEGIDIVSPEVAQPEPEPVSEAPQEIATEKPEDLPEPAAAQPSTTADKQEPAQPVQRRQRPPQKKAVVVDIDKIIATLEAPVEPMKTGDAAALEHELEQLVKLSSAVSSRMAGIVKAAIQAAQDGIERCDAIMEFLNKR